MNKRVFLSVMLVMVLVFETINAQEESVELHLPSDVPEVITYFYTEALSLLKFIEINRREDYYDKFNFIPFFISANVKVGIDSGIGFQYNGMIGGVIRFNKYLSMPLFFSAAGGIFSVENEWDGTGSSYYRDIVDYNYNNLYTGGGLVLSTKFGTLGAFVGYYKMFSNFGLYSEMGERPLRYGVIPVLNVSEYPLLKYALSTIQNYLSFDFHESKLNISSTTTKVISRPIEIDSFRISSLYYFYSNEFINAVYRNEIHGGGISLEFDLFRIEFETGHRNISLAYLSNVSIFDETIDLGSGHWYFQALFSLIIEAWNSSADLFYIRSGIMIDSMFIYPIANIKVFLGIGTGGGSLGVRGNPISDLNLFGHKYVQIKSDDW